jgi:ubiquinone/menaquinone biosynthesis C-methylase UbiE
VQRFALSDFAIPDFSVDGRTVLDVGCGNGHALAYPHFARAKERVGIDVDTAAIDQGSAKFPELKLIYGSAEHIQFAPEAFDVVISRVALPYTDIRAAMSEINRVMKPGGDLFLTMHDWYHQWEFLSGALKKRALRRVLDHAYILSASAVFIATGRVPTRPGRGTRETFQTEGCMRRELGRAGFSDVAFRRTPRHWRITARKPAF